MQEYCRSMICCLELKIIKFLLVYNEIEKKAPQLQGLVIIKYSKILIILTVAFY